MELAIPPGSKLYADGAYNCFDLEDILEEENILLLAKRGKGAKNRVRTKAEEKEISNRRQIIETALVVSRASCRGASKFERKLVFL